MPILIISSSDDFHATLVKSELVRIGLETRLIDTEKVPSELALTLQENGIHRLGSIGDVSLEDIRVIWWRRPAFNSKIATYSLFDRDFVDVECRQAIEGILWGCSCAWINDPAFEYRANRKLLQISTAVRLGMRVPKTIVTSSPERALEFAHSIPGRIIVKRIGTRKGISTKTALIDESQISASILSIQKCPTLFQEYIEPGFDLRVIVIDNYLFAFQIDVASGSSPVDGRFDLDVPHTSIELPNTMNDQLRKLVSSLGLVTGVIDLRVDRDGNVFFLEINPSGQWAYLELLTNVSISAAFAASLAKVYRV